MIDLILQPLSCLLSFVFFALLVLALLSPFEALGWWSGWSHRRLERDPASWPAVSADAMARAADRYLVYLTAIGGISSETISYRERGFLNLLQERLPNSVLVDDVYPYSVSNNPLNGERQFAWLWQRIHDSRMRGKGGMLAALIFVRNVLQVAVSADGRYGPIYNLGVAREIARSLVRHGYPAGSRQPIVLMGWSGGGQITVGVARYLNLAFDAPIRIISIGGVTTDDPGIAYVDHLYHLNGSKDKFPLIGDILYPGRWPFVRHSAWNQAMRHGRITVIDPGPMVHTGRGDYFDFKSKLEDGTTYVAKTADITAEVILAAEANHARTHAD